MTAQIKVDPKNLDACAWGLIKKTQLAEHPEVRAASLKDGMTVRLEDDFQDFLEFDIKGGRIVETRPFQGWLWDGRTIINEENIDVGDRLILGADPKHRQMTIRYPVIGISPLFESEA